jgi:16S rRNA A1518/A1519 N6-dimethyltransferase RsmA/KsgA/DIM1 with predicted DNA glycosylase/AP lyase activity
VSAAVPAAARGQHFLRSAHLARAIVVAADIPCGALVLDLGAGFGRLTQPLLDQGAHVVAVEIDPKLARSLERRCPMARVVCGDATTMALPRRPFRVVANLPFAITTATVRRLLASPYLQRADLVVARGFALKWTAREPRIDIVRWLSRRAFMPPPATDAAVISLRGRDPRPHGRIIR